MNREKRIAVQFRQYRRGRYEGVNTVHKVFEPIGGGKLRTICNTKRTKGLYEICNSVPITCKKCSHIIDITIQ